MKWTARSARAIACLCVSAATSAWAADATDGAVTGTWQTVTDGVLPANALALARDDAGNDQFLCRTFATGGQQLGHTTRQTPQCLVIADGAEQQLDAFEVLIAAAPPLPNVTPGDPSSVIAPAAPSLGAATRAKRQRVDGALLQRSVSSDRIAQQIAAASATSTNVSAGAAIAADAVIRADTAITAAPARARQRSDRLMSAISSDRANGAVAAVTPPLSPFCPKQAYAPPTATEVVSVGFDADSGEPYIDKTAPDGSVWRELNSGDHVHIQPGQNPTHCSLPRTYISAQPPLPPELPADGARGRAWIAEHNDLLLAVIRNLVRGDAAILQGIKQAEARTAEGDLFKQIAYRTGIAAFYAGKAR